MSDHIPLGYDKLTSLFRYNDEEKIVLVKGYFNQHKVSFKSHESVIELITNYINNGEYKTFTKDKYVKFSVERYDIFNKTTTKGLYYVILL